MVASSSIPLAVRALRRGFLLLLVLAAPLLALGADTNVLFVGNSYSMQMVEVFRFLSKATHQAGRIEGVLVGGAQLKTHLDKGDAAKKISAGGWNYIVLQEQSQLPSFPEDQVKAVMDPSVEAFRKMCETAKAKPMLFCHWAKSNGDRDNHPDDTYEAQRDRLEATFARLGREQHLTLVPVGKAWDLVRKENPALQLYAPDGSHPSMAGAYLAACVFQGAIHGREILAKLPTVQGVADADAKILRVAAAKALVP